MRDDRPKPVDAVAWAGLLGAAVVLASLFLHGCTFAHVRYLEGAQDADELVCKVEANTFVCKPLYKGLLHDGVRLAPANTQPRMEM